LHVISVDVNSCLLSMFGAVLFGATLYDVTTVSHSHYNAGLHSTMIDDEADDHNSLINNLQPHVIAEDVPLILGMAEYNSNSQSARGILSFLSSQKMIPYRYSSCCCCCCYCCCSSYSLLVRATLIKKLRLRRFKSDRGEIWHERHVNQTTCIMTKKLLLSGTRLTYTVMPENGKMGLLCITHLLVISQTNASVWHSFSQHVMS